MGIEGIRLVTSKLIVGFTVGFLASPIYSDPPKPEPTPTEPTPAEIDAARQAGQTDGRPDGNREGDDRGPSDGRRKGFENGRDDGYRYCYDEEKRRATDAGFTDGYRRGDDEGERDGISNGERAGYEQGERDGRVDGNRRADRDAKAAATPPGRQAGYEDANSSDAEARGYADGLIAGDRRARETARRVDYQRGRTDYSNERFSEAIENQDAFAQKERMVFHSKGQSLAFAGIALQGLASFSVSAPSPDYRYSNPRRNYNHASLNEAYRSSYNSAYRSGFQSTYDSRYRTAYDHAYRDGKDSGCQEARRQSFQRYYDEGYSRGHSQGYNTSYRSSYDRAYKASYDRRFRDVSNQTYSESYDDYYRTHYDAARRAAYEERVGQLYRLGHDRGDNEKFSQVYPIYAQEEYQRGRADEQNDFALRPVRLLGAEATETLINGLYEPGEPIRFKVDLRNFSDQSVNPQDLSLDVQAVTTDGVVLSEPTSGLVRGLNRKSMTRVSEALEIILTESRVNRPTNLIVSATYQGRKIGEHAMSLTPKYLVALEFAEAPKLTEGLPATIKVRVKNQSPTTATGALNVELLSDSKKIELIQKTAGVASLPTGGSAVVEFKAIARTQESSPRIPLALMVTSMNARRVGALDFSGEVPVMNDYRITVSGNLDSLRSTGITRIPYVIRNISSRLLFKGLQLKMTVLDAEDEDTFAILGRNPQFLTPLDNGRSLSFVFPVLVKKPNSGAIIELEVQEDGRTTVIHRVNFKEGR